MAASKTMQALIFLGLLATSCLAQAPAPAPTMLLPPVESPTPAITPTAEPPVTPAPMIPPTATPPTMTPTTSPVASPPKGLAPTPYGSTTPSKSPVPAPAPAPEQHLDDSSTAITNKAFLVSSLIAGALYAVVLA